MKLTDIERDFCFVVPFFGAGIMAMDENRLFTAGTTPGQTGYGHGSEYAMNMGAMVARDRNHPSALQKTTQSDTVISGGASNSRLTGADRFRCVVCRGWRACAGVVIWSYCNEVRASHPLPPPPAPLLLLLLLLPAVVFSHDVWMHHNAHRAVAGRLVAQSSAM